MSQGTAKQGKTTNFDGTGTDVVAVVVVTYNSQRFLTDLIGSLDDGLAGIAWHLTVADNASADDTVVRLRELAPKATVVEMGRNAGYAAGINAAVAKAGPHTAVLVLNPDVRLGKGSVAHLLHVLRTPGTGIAVPRLEDGDGVLIPRCAGEPTTLRTLALGPARVDPGRPAGRARRDRHRPRALRRRDDDRLGRGLDR